MEKKTLKMPEERDHAQCSRHMLAVHDTMDILSGKWKIMIIGSLSFSKKRFMELQRDITGIGAKMLSKELKELEDNDLVKRTVHNTKPVTVEYELTEYGGTLQEVIGAIVLWGTEHRRRIFSK